MELLGHLKNPGSLHLPSLLSSAWTAPWLQSLHILYSVMTSSRKRKGSFLPVHRYWRRMLPFPETPSKLPVTRTGVTCSTLSHSLEWDQHDRLRPVIYSWNWVMWRRQYLNKSRIFGRQPRMSATVPLCTIPIIPILYSSFWDLSATGSLLWFFFSEFLLHFLCSSLLTAGLSALLFYALGVSVCTFQLHSLFF